MSIQETMLEIYLFAQTMQVNRNDCRGIGQQQFITKTEELMLLKTNYVSFVQ